MSDEPQVEFVRELRLLKGYDCEFYPCVNAGTDHDCRGDTKSGRYHGRHGVDLLAVLRQGNRAVQFKLYTMWHRPLTRPKVKDFHDKWSDRECLNAPIPADLGYHSPEPRWEGQDPISTDCEYTGGACYYDGSSLNADPVFDRLTMEGDEGMWAALEDYFREVFGEREAKA